MLAQKLAKLPNMFFEPPIGHVAAVPRENFRLRTVRRHPIFVRIAENELACLQRLASARRRLHAIPFDRRLRQPVAIAEMLMCVGKRRNGVKVEHGQHFDAGHTAATSFWCSETHRSRSASSRAKRMTMACRSGFARPPTQCSGALTPLSPSISARAAMPCLNSSGNEEAKPHPVQAREARSR